MFKEFFLFEFRYRKRRPVTYVYFGIIFLLSFLGIASPIRAAVGQIMANAPYLITVWTIVLSFVFTMITSAVMGVSIVRDFDHNTESILFSTPIKKNRLPARPVLRVSPYPCPDQLRDLDGTDEWLCPREIHSVGSFLDR